MTGLFADLHLCPALTDASKINIMIEQTYILGYKIVGINVSQLTRDKIQIIMRFCKKQGLDFVKRSDLVPRNVSDLLRSLRRNRKKLEIIAVICYSKNIARQAAKDRRVDLLSFPVINIKKRFFDFSEAQLASSSLTALEIDMSSLLYNQGLQRTRLISYLRREIKIARKFGVPVVLSSGSNIPLYLRKPKDYEYLSHIFDMNNCEARKSLSDIPLNILERNRKKLSSDYIAPGVYLINDKNRTEKC
jgi:ribonuclease P/MRP protein subunit RPP1